MIKKRILCTLQSLFPMLHPQCGKCPTSLGPLVWMMVDMWKRVLLLLILASARSLEEQGGLLWGLWDGLDSTHPDARHTHTHTHSDPPIRCGMGLFALHPLICHWFISILRGQSSCFPHRNLWNFSVPFLGGTDPQARCYYPSGYVLEICEGFFFGCLYAGEGTIGS